MHNFNLLLCFFRFSWIRLRDYFLKPKKKKKDLSGFTFFFFFDRLSGFPIIYTIGCYFCKSNFLCKVYFLRQYK